MKYMTRLMFILLLSITINAQAGVIVGSKVPGFTLQSADGGNVKLSEFRGKVVLINYWATWCGPCRQELPELDKIHKQFSAKGFTMLGINIDNKPKNAIKMLKRLKIKFPVVFDPKKKVSEQMNVDAMPFTILVDQSGVARYVHRGYVSGDENKYRSEIKKVLK